jgi:hypothetical protein
MLLIGYVLAFVMDKFSVLSSQNVQYTINNFCVVFGRHGYVDNILELKRKKMCISRRMCS